MALDLKQRLANILGNRVVNAKPLGSNNTTMTFVIKLEDDREFIVKSPKTNGMDLTQDETLMLKHLEKHSKLPIPTVVWDEDNLLILEKINYDADYINPNNYIDVARQLAHLHSAPADYFGFEIDTSVNGVFQSNEVNMNWTTFFAENRLRWLSQLCMDCEVLPTRYGQRIDALIDQLPTIIPNDIPPSLLHGNLWKGNILTNGSNVAAFIAPGLYYGHSEMDLAFLSLFAKVPQKFYDAYSEIRPIDDGFMEERKWLYLMWPILISIRTVNKNFVKHLDNMLSKFNV